MAFSLVETRIRFAGLTLGSAKQALGSTEPTLRSAESLLSIAKWHLGTAK
jgi:hypothetical protein